MCVVQIYFQVYGTKKPFDSTYDAIAFNVGGGWSKGSNSFVVPVSGIYYFSYSIGVPAYTSADWVIIADSTNYCDSALGDNHEGLDIISRGCLLRLTAGW